MAKGDQFKVTTTQGTFIVDAEKAGRNLTVEYNKDGNVQWLDVVEKTWTNKIVSISRFRVDAVVAITSNFELDG